MTTGNAPNNFDRWLDETLGREARKSDIQLSHDFDQRFWEKAESRKSLGWPTRVLGQWHWEITFPNLTQAVAVLLVAVSVGAAGGAYSAFSNASASAQTLSGFQEQNGVSSNSVAGAYFRSVSSEANS